MIKIFLIGFMGSGKTTIGSMLAEKRAVSFLDMDDIIRKRSAMTITELFRLHGESVFREAEKEVLQQIIQNNEDFVVATGGGAPCFSDNMEVMNKNGITIYIKLSADMLFSRLQHDTKDRPLLADKKNLKAFIAETLVDREKYYKRAHHVILVGKENADEKICEKILLSINNQADGK